MLKPLFLAALTIAMVPGACRATLISAFLPEYSGPALDTTNSYPQAAVTAGTFTYTIPVGSTITAATVKSTFGNSSINSTALSTLFVAGKQVASCSSVNDPCYNPVNPFDDPAPWTYTFSAAQLSSLSGGTANFTIVQNSAFQIQSGIAELDITVTSTATPEPATMSIVSIGLAGLALLRRRRAAR